MSEYDFRIILNNGRMFYFSDEISYFLVSEKGEPQHCHRMPKSRLAEIVKAFLDGKTVEEVYQCMLMYLEKDTAELAARAAQLMKDIREAR